MAELKCHLYYDSISIFRRILYHGYGIITTMRSMCCRKTIFPDIKVSRRGTQKNAIHKAKYVGHEITIKLNERKVSVVMEMQSHELRKKLKQM